MTTEIDALVKKFVTFINTADPKLARELISSEAVFFVPGQVEPMRGPDGYMSIINMMRNGFSDIQWDIKSYFADGVNIGARFVMHGTHDGNFFGIPATNNKMTAQAINLYKVAKGQIVEKYGQPDLLAIMAQIGALPPR